MKTLILIALLPAMVGLSQAPRHIIERTPLAESGGQITFVDKYSDGTIDRTSVPQTITLQNRDYSVATNIARVVCVNTFRTNAFWCNVYAVYSVDGTVKTNMNFTAVDQKQLQAERKESLTHLARKPSVDRLLAVSNRLAVAERAMKGKPSVTSKLVGEIIRTRKMEPASDVVSERVNSRGELVQKLTTGKERTVQLKRVASVPVAPAKKAIPPAETSSAGTATATGAAGALVGAAAAAALKKRK